MRLSVQFPLHTKSENDLRSLPFAVARVAKTKGAKAANGLAIAIAKRTAKQRIEVRRYLDSQLPRLRETPSKPPGDDGAFGMPFGITRHDRRNFFRVTIIRISAGTLDTDGLAGALKAVRDEVAAWLGIDDSARAPASWRYGQQRGPRGVYAVRIEIEDDDPRKAEDIGHSHAIIVGPPIGKLGPVVGDVQHAPRPAQNDGRPQEQAPGGVPRVGHGLSRPGEGTLPRRRRWDPRKPLEKDDEGLLMGVGRDGQVMGGDHLGAARVALAELAQERREARQARLVFRRSYYAPAGQDEDADEVTLEELTGPLFDAMEPPLRIIKGGRELTRRQDFHPALGEHWIYEPAPSAARASDEREARR